MCYSIEIDKKIKELAIRYNAYISDRTYEKLDYEFHKSRNELEETYRVFKNKYASAIIRRNNQRELVPLRFNLLPHFAKTENYTILNKRKGKCEELSTYNARVESIKTKKSYKNLIGRHHCVVPARSFFEWGIRDGKRCEYCFSYDNEDVLFACIWDHWGDKNEEGINSFAILTTPPRKEILDRGHKRSPLIISPEKMNEWLDPQENFWQIIDEPYKKVLTGIPVVKVGSYKWILRQKF